MDTNGNKKIGIYFGFTPKITWEVLSPTNNTTCFSSDFEYEVRNWFKDHINRFPESQFKNYHVGKWEHYPNFIENDADAIKLIPCLAKQGFTATLTAIAPGEYDFCIDKNRFTVAATDVLMPTIATAICTAVLKLCKEG